LGELPASRLDRRLVRVRVADLAHFACHSERAMVTTKPAIVGGPLILAAG